MEPYSSEARFVAGFLARYSGATHALYAIDLRIFSDWCKQNGVNLFDVTRLDLECFVRYLETQRGNSPSTIVHRLGVVRLFYKLAVADGLIPRDPSVMVRMPAIYHDPSTILWLDRSQMGRLITSARETSLAHETLVTLMGIMALRVSEACAVDIEHFHDDELGYRTLTVTGKSGRVVRMPMPIPVLRTIERAREDRTVGPLILTCRGNRQTRNGAYDWITRLAKKAYLPDNLHPHSLRHSAITAALDAGVELRDVQVFARHSDPRMTAHYDRRRFSMDRHASHAVARWMQAGV